jgi:transcriptional regulator with XRE-family HTH domain
MTNGEAAAFGRRLREVRVERGITQRALARAAGISMVAAAALEHGACEPDLSTVARIARVLDVPPRDLVEDEPRGLPAAERLARRELAIFPPYKREQLRRAGADLADAEDFYYFCAERVAHGEAIASFLAPEPRHLEMLRLRLLAGLSMREVGERTGVTGSRVAQILSAYFAVRGVPPAVKARRRRAAR